ncbi:MAG: histidine kinase [Archangium sp.]
MPSVTLVVLAALASTPLEDGWSWRKGDLHVQDGRVALPLIGWEPLAHGASLRRAMSDDVTLWLTHPLPATLEPDSALALSSVIGHFEVFVGSERVYQHPVGQGVEGRGMNGLAWHLIPIPPGSEGKSISLRVRSTYALAGIQGVPRLTTRAEWFETMVREDTPRFVIGAVLAVLAVLLFIALRGDDAAERRLAAAFGTYAACAALYVLFYTRLKQVLLPITPSWWLFLYTVALAVLPAAFFFITDAVFATRSKWMERMKRFQIWSGVVVVIGSALLWAGLELIDSPSAASPVGLVFFGMTTLHRIGLAVTSTASTVVMIRWSVGKGEASDVPKARILLAGVAFLFIAVWLNVITSTGLAGSANWVPVGMLGLTLAMATLAQRSWRESRERALNSERALNQRAMEKEAMLRDLHDGIGSVTTNIRMLAELGQRDEKRAVQSLATIAELSSEGISELRTFIQSLDENQVDWPSLSAELRRFGGQLIESQGMQFQLDAELAPSAPPPSGAVTLALLRIFREALTNVVKHAGAKEVRVRLQVNAKDLTLEVRDDGEAASSSGGGLDTGRGLRNMRARAEELGGQFRFERSQGGRVSIELPLVH